MNQQINIFFKAQCYHIIQQSLFYATSSYFLSKFNITTFGTLSVIVAIIWRIISKHHYYTENKRSSIWQFCHHWQWWQSCQTDDLLFSFTIIYCATSDVKVVKLTTFLFSVYVQKYILHNYIHHGDTTYWFRWWERQMAYSEDWFQLTLHQQLSQYVWWRKSWEYQRTQTLNQHRE